MNISPVSYSLYSRVNSFKASGAPYKKEYNLNNGEKLSYAICTAYGEFDWESFGLNDKKTILFSKDGKAYVYSTADKTRKNASKDDINELLNLLKANRIPKPQAITRKIYK